ncbi:TSUP family transporter [Streptomyces sp. NPDC058534]|uniref:TSUP family transporter n=1 Tax=Streptomyces sp. NPDC058534 TaxID=3346541 RepID=UPI003661F8AC
MLAELRGSGPLLLLLAAGSSAGALAARVAPAALIRWAFVAYVALTVVALLLRPGFLRPRAPSEAAADGVPRPLPAVVGAPVGAVAAFLGVGGSVLTVPAMRRAGHSMRVATAPANPLTLAIALPAAAVFLAGAQGLAGAPAHLVGLVDLRAAAGLLLGALPVIAVLRRRPPRIPDRAHAWTYVALLGAVTVAMVL